MRKEYVKPYIIAECFDMTQSIAAGCVIKLGNDGKPDLSDLDDALKEQINTAIGNHGWGHNDKLFGQGIECDKDFDDLDFPEGTEIINVFNS